MKKYQIVKSLIEKEGLTQRQVAREVNRPASTVCQGLNGNNNKMLKQIAEWFVGNYGDKYNVSLEDLYPTPRSFSSRLDEIISNQKEILQRLKRE